LAENRKLRGEVNLLKANAQVVIDARSFSPASPSPQTETVQILPASFGLTASEKEALDHAISHKLMKDEGWSIDAYGRILNEKGRAIFKPGFATAIRKILGTHHATTEMPD